MKKGAKIKDFALKVLYGISSGIFWYLLYLYAIPYLIGQAGIPIRGLEEILVFAVVIFVSLEVTVSLLENIVYKFLLNTFVRILGLWLLIRLLNNGVITTRIQYSEGITTITMEFTPIIYLIAVWTFATALLDLVGMISRKYF
ncbi:MAG: hypothetical protein QXJ17_06850 [Nitrososphaeria archaeon]